MAQSISELEKYLDREFGPIDNLVDQTERRSRVMLDEAPDADLSDLKDVVGDSQAGKSGPVLPEINPQDYNVQSEGNMDRTRLFGAGVLDLGEMVVGAGEYAARQSSLTRDSVAPALENVRGGINEIREGILSGVSPEYLDRVGKEIMTLDPSKSLWRSGNPIQVADAIYGKFVRSLPSTLAVMLPAGRLFKAGHTAGALTYLGASEGGLSVGAIANNLTDEIKGMTNEELLKESPRYAQIYQQVDGDEAEARSRFTAEAQGIAPLVGGMAVAGISLATGRLLKPVFDPGDAAAKGLNLGQRIGRGFIAEFPQEGSQGVSEQMAQNFAAKVYDENRPLMEGALEAFGQEGLIGGLTGGAVSGAFGTRPQKPLSAPIEDEGGQLTLPGFGPQITDPDAGGGPPPAGVTGVDPETGQTTFDFQQDGQEVSDRTEQLNLGPGYDLRSQRTYQTRDGETRELPPDMQVKGRDISDETGFTMPGTTTAPTGYTVWVEDTKGKTKGKESKQESFETKAEADAYAEKLKLDEEKGQKVRRATGQRVVPPMQTDEQGQGQLGLFDRNPLRDRVPGDRSLPEGGQRLPLPEQVPYTTRGGDQRTAEIMPDEMDQPSGEPLADIEAQLADFKNKGGRTAVYLSPEQRNAPRQVPKGAKVIPNWDGKGGTMIFKSASNARRGAELARKARNGEITWQEAIGLLTLSGKGKPVNGRFVVQKLDEAGNVQRETMVETRSQALRKQKAWGEGTVITTPEAAVRRRAVLMEQPLRTEDAEEVDVRVNREIEDEIADRKVEQEREEKLRKQEEEQKAREEYERKQRFEEESRKEFDETISDEEIERLATYHVRVSRLVETADGWLDTEAVDKEYGSYEEAEAAAAEIREQNNALLREYGLPESKEQFGDYLKEQKKRIVDDPPEDLSQEERVKWTQDNKGKLTKSEFADLQKRVRELGKKMYGGVKVEGTDELDIQFERAVRARGDRKAQTYDESPTGKDKLGFQRREVTTASVEDEEAYKQSITAGEEMSDTVPEGTTDEEVVETPYAETASPATTVEKKARQDYGSTPGKKLKFIRRERGAQIRRKAEIRNVKDTKVETPVGKVSTRALTYESVPAEESREQKENRKAKNKAARTRLRMALNKARQFAKRFETSGEYGRYDGQGYLKARRTYERLIELAESMLTPRIYKATFIQDGDIQTKQFDDRKSAERYLRRYVGLNDEMIAQSITVETVQSESAGFTAAANKLSRALERVKLKSMTPEQFTKEFGKSFDDQQYEELRSQPANKRETLEKRRDKIEKKGGERRGENRWREIRRAWDNNELYRELVAPVMSKIVNAAWESFYAEQANRSVTDIIYTPTDTEIRQVASVLKAWKAPGTKLNPDIFAAPLRDTLRRAGFTFDDEGNINGYEPITAQEETTGTQLQSGQMFPAYGDGAIGPLSKPKPIKLRSPELQAASRQEYRALQEKRKQAAKERQEKKEYAATRRARARRMNRAESERQKTPGSRRAEVNEAMELAEKREAVRTIEKVNALVERFKERVAHSKTKNSRIIKEEQRMIAGLESLNVWRRTGEQTGVISIGGYYSKMIRLVGPRIGRGEGKIPGKRAKELAVRNARIPIPKELMPVWRSMQVKKREGVIYVDESGTAETGRRGYLGSTYESEIADLLEETDEIVDFDLFLENIDLAENTPQLDAAASEVGDMIRDRYSRQPINNVLDAVINNLPENHFYTTLAKKLRSLGMNDIQIHYDWAGTKFRGRKKNNLGLYDPNTGRIYLNRRVMGENMDALSGVKAIHTILHETLHAATAKELKANSKLRQHFFFVRQAAIAEWKRRNGPKNMPYGLQLKLTGLGSYTPVDEFVAEVYASKELQDFLKTVPVAMEGSMNPLATAWSYIKSALVNLMGWGNIPQITNLFDAFMAPADMVFQSAGQRVGGKDLNYGGDGLLASAGNAIHSKLAQRDEIWKRMKARAKNSSARFSSFAMNISTMEQFVEMYEKFFNISTEEGQTNPLRDYLTAFENRNGHAAARMEAPTKLSGEWTSLEESDPDSALEMSEIMTDARLYEITPDQPLEHERNEHLKSSEQQERHAELKARFDALPESAKTLYRKVRAYYAETAKEQQSFLMQSGLRGITGVTFTEEQLSKVKSKSDLDELLAPHVVSEERADLVDTLYEMSRVPFKTQGDYFPLLRYGDHVAYAEGLVNKETFEDRKSARERRAEIAGKDPTLDAVLKTNADGSYTVETWVRDFRMGESRSEIDKKHAELKAKYPEGSGVTVYDAQPRRKVMNESGIGSNAQLRSILQALEGEPAAQAAIKAFYLQGLSEMSMRQRELTSANRLGVDGSQQHRHLATYARQSSYYISQLEFGWKMAEAIKEMEQFVGKRSGFDNTHDLGRVVEHLKKRDQMGAVLPEVHWLVRSGVEGTHFFMLTSPSYWAINATQPWMVTLPQLGAKFGYGNSYAMLRDTMSKISPILGRQALKTRLGLKALTDRELREESFNIIDDVLNSLKESTSAGEFAELSKMIETLRRAHIIDINVFTEMRELSQGKVGGVKGAWQGVVDASRVMAHLTEVNNRLLTSITAYKLARNDGMTADDATQYAKKITSQTQFNYSSQNKPPLFQAGGPLGAAAPLMFQFMQWPQHMYAQLIRNYQGMVEAGVMNKSEARTALLGLLATHTAVGGMIGMTLQPIKWAIGMALMAFGDEDEPYTFANALSGQTFDQLIAEIAASVFGTTMGTFISKGIPAGLGIDLSTRMSMGTLYFIDLRGDDANSVLGSLMASFGGATLNQGVNFSRGLGYAMDGDYLRGLETAAPKFGRDVLRAIRYYREGLVNRQGDTVIDASQMNLAEILAQSIGFAPTDVSDFYDAQAAMKGAESFAKKRRERLLKDFRTAESGNERMKVLREIRGFNRGNRQEAIEADTLWSTWEAKFKREFRYRRLGANIDEEKARFYREYGAPYRD